jgi:hypothetical protein
MGKKLIVWLLIIGVCLSSMTSIAFAEIENPDRVEIEEKLEALAKKRGVPSVIAKSVARVESCFQQYTDSGRVYTGSRGSIGIMQINNRYGDFDTQKLKFDIDYNLEAGIEMLLRKWDMAVNKLPQIGNMDPNILEHWYFALWAYNGWADSNNPNTGKKKYTYTELIYKVAKEEYGQEINLIDPKKLPKTGKPDKASYFDSPGPVHRGDIVVYREGQPMIADVDSSLNLRLAPGDRVIGQLDADEKIEIVKGPELVGGYYWYEVKNDKKRGWVAGNWLALDEVTTTYHGKFEVVRDEAPLRDMPLGQTIAELDEGDVVEIVSKPYFDGNLEWIQIKDENGNSGWMEDFLLRGLEGQLPAKSNTETQIRSYVKEGQEENAVVVLEKDENGSKTVVNNKENEESEDSTESDKSVLQTEEVTTKVSKKYSVVDVTSSLNIRGEPSVISDKIGKLYNKDRVEILEGPVKGREYTWYKIKDERSGVTGWVAGEFLIMES